MSLFDFLYDSTVSKYSHSLFQSGSAAKNSAMDKKNWHKIVSDIYLQQGVSFDTNPERRNVLAKRRFSPVSRDNAFGEYNDVMIIAWSSNKGAILNWEFFSANTDPSYQYLDGRDKKIRPGKHSDGEDANGDGFKDLGMLPPGAYQYSSLIQSHPVLRLIFRPAGKFSDGTPNPKGARVYRDINRDGYFNQADEDLIKYPDLMYERNTMYIHPGGVGNTWSSGCQTLPSSDFNRFKSNMATAVKFGQLTFTYLLIDESN